MRIFGPGLQPCNLAVQQVFEFSIHGVEHFDRAQLLMRFDLRQKPFACFNELPAPGRQRSEKSLSFNVGGCALHRAGKP